MEREPETKLDGYTLLPIFPNKKKQPAIRGGLYPLLSTPISDCSCHNYTLGLYPPSNSSSQMSKMSRSPAITHTTLSFPVVAAAELAKILVSLKVTSFPLVSRKPVFSTVWLGASIRLQSLRDICSNR